MLNIFYLGILKKNQIKLLDFQSDLADVLTKAGKPVVHKKRGRPSLENEPEEVNRKQTRKPIVPDPVVDVRKDKLDHFPLFQEEQGRCRNCKKGFSRITCSKCKVRLCLTKANNCFTAYHT